MEGAVELVQPYAVGGAIQWTLRGTPPGAGNNFTLPIDSAWVWRLTVCTFTLNTSGAAANRYATVQQIGGDTLPYRVDGAGVVVTAGSIQRFSGSMYRGSAEWATGTDVFFPLTPIFLRGGDSLAINVANIQAGDSLTAIYLTFDRFYESHPC